MPATPIEPALSVVIPAFNSAPWLETTLAALRTALARTDWTAEVIVVDDGSTDDSRERLASLAEQYPYELRVVEQQNQGVFLAVWHGLRAAKAPRVLILNSRLLLHEGSLAYLEGAGALTGGRTWNGHVETDPGAPLIGRFWEVPTHVFWGGYLGRPRPTEITAENFDRVPKGTGCLLVSRDTMLEAYDACWPDENARFTSDDTKLLRYIAGRQPIVLDPGFSATYRPRTTLRKFLAHATGRGTMFVDSYAGTSTARNLALVALVAAPPLALAGTAVAVAGRRWGLLGWIGAIAAAAITTPAVVGAVRGAPRRAIESYLLYIIPFGAVFWRGLARGVVMHRRAFLRGAPSASAPSADRDPR